MTNAELREILEGIGTLDHLQPEDVVATARNGSHPLHPKFEWDNKKAGHLHRLQQARMLINAAIAATVVVHNVKVQVPAYVQDPRSSDDGYIRLSAVEHESETAVRVVSQAAKTALGHLNRVRGLALTLGVPTKLDTAAKHLQALITEVETRG